MPTRQKSAQKNAAACVKTLICRHCNKDHTQRGAVVRRYDKKNEYKPIRYVTGRYRMDKSFEADRSDDKSVALDERFDLHADSDICAHCDRVAKPKVVDVNFPKDPINFVKIYADKNGSISFENFENARAYTRNTVQRGLIEGLGFEVMIFDNKQRFQGAMDMIPLLDGGSGSLTYAYCEFPNGLYALAVKGEYSAEREWTDLRGNKARS